MTESIRQFILQLLEKKHKSPKNIDVDSFNYVKILDSDMESSEFMAVGGLDSIISRKMASGGNE